MDFEIKNKILTFLDNYGGRNFKEFPDLNQDERKEIGTQARENFIELSKYVLEEYLKNGNYHLVSTNQWQNSGYFSKYFWSQYKKEGYENLPTSVSFLILKKTDSSLVFRISLEEDGKIAEKDHVLHNSFLEAHDIRDDFKNLIVDEEVLPLEDVIK